MANITWAAIGAKGHFSNITLAPRSSITLGLQNSSYNSVKVFPLSMLVQNTGNDGGVVISDYQSVDRLVPPNTNQKIDVSSMLQCSVRNEGRVPCVLLLLDKEGETSSDANLTPSLSSGVSTNDFLYHFEQSTVATLVNSGSESMFAQTNTADFATTASNVKFGVGGVIKGAAAGVQNIEWADAGFFEMSKNFTVDFWYNRLGVLISQAAIFYFRTTLPNLQESIHLLDNIPISRIGISVGGALFASSAFCISNAGGYQFIQLVKEDNNWRLYVDGVLVINIQAASTATRNIMGIGGHVAATGTPNAAWDEFRYAKGFVQSDNSVPTSPYY